MAGTRLWISAIILGELIILTVLSLYYGLCVQNDDYLCHALDDPINADSIVSLRLLPRPSWWSKTLHIHLVVEESSQNLYGWSQILEEWMKTSQVEGLPYFGHTEIHMKVVPKSDQLWKKTENTTKIADVSSIWTHMSDYSSNIGSSDEQQDLDWMIYVPVLEGHLQLLAETTDIQDQGPSWSTWKRGSMQLVTISTGTIGEPEMLPSLISIVAPWLETTMKGSEPIPDGMSENDYLRQLQFSWHKTIMEDFDDMKRLLSPVERKEILVNLGKSSQSLSSRLESLLEVRAILESAVERNQKSLTPEFPLEHYAAVFLPLLFPLLMPFLTSFVKELKRFKEKVNKKHERAKALASESEATPDKGPKQD